ncbi:hypothetical protein BHQ15_04680 [Mycolicibacillus koreensis]|nr:hypothetical protein BHQ15_04680 [Mycolicibacillus koreensis]
MRTPVAALTLVALLAGGCTSVAPPPVPSAPSSSRPAGVKPERIKRVTGLLPAGYEYGDAAGKTSPAQIWGLGPDARTDPPVCAALIDPPAEDPDAGTGIFGSGPGGILYAVVAAAPALDPALTEQCATFTVTFARTDVDVRVIDAPAVEGARTVGLTSQGRTLVEGGGEIDTHAETYLADVDGYRVITAAVIDPGSPAPPLPAGFAADLLVAAVAELRGEPGAVG